VRVCAGQSVANPPTPLTCENAVLPAPAAGAGARGVTVVAGLAQAAAVLGVVFVQAAFTQFLPGQRPVVGAGGHLVAVAGLVHDDTALPAGGVAGAHRVAAQHGDAEPAAVQTVVAAGVGATAAGIGFAIQLGGAGGAGLSGGNGLAAACADAGWPAGHGCPLSSLME